LSQIFAPEQAFMLCSASPIFHRDVFQKPISHTNNNSSEHGGGACDDLRSRVFYNIVIDIRQGLGARGGLVGAASVQKSKKPSRQDASGREMTS
jgi:hypothetical protein